MIRLAEKSDLPGLLELERRAFPKDHFTRAQLLHLLTRASGIFLVDAMFQTSTIRASAILLFRKNSGTARLYSIGVHPDYQARGLARRLLRRCEILARLRRCRTMALEVREENRAARRLYESVGYVIRGRIPEYYSDGAAAITYEKQL
ncbi:MAG: GNAT family N-acetyltransferase [candidate division Zixibacteria bacterium]|nr:GNAT family N-acetyltransferase [candidate division Zixibacteria bacterium]